MIASRRAWPARRTARGFTLIEAMVALVVLSIGLLGIAALYIETLRANRTALYRTVAINLATDLGDMMRANRAPADAYDCGAPCTAAGGGNVIAIADLTQWLAAVTTQLPGGQGAVVYTPGTGTTPPAYVVTVSWTEVGQVAATDFALRVEI